MITPKRVTSGGTYLRGLAPGQHSFEEMSQRWRAKRWRLCVCFDKPGNRIQPPVPIAMSQQLINYLLLLFWPCLHQHYYFKLKAQRYEDLSYKLKLIA